MVRRAIALAMTAAVVLAGCAVAPDSRLEAYLRAAAGGEADRGWSYLDETTRQLGYDGDEEQYRADAVAADWSALRWSGATVVWTDDGLSDVEVRLLSPATSVPAFLIARRILSGLCEGGHAVGLSAFVNGRLFGDGRLGGGGLTGSQVRCNSLFIGDAAFDE